MEGAGRMIEGDILVTGAGGFVGRRLAKRLAGRAAGRLVLCDRALEDAPAGAETVEGDLADPKVMDRALGGDPDVVFHLASVPSGASERDPMLSRAVNLEASLALLDRLAAREAPARLVYASSIAALGSGFAGPVDDDTTPRPTLTYGAHKLMVETALGDWARRGRIDAVALRLPGIVARPPMAGGFGSAFWSEVFHAIRRRAPYRCPAGPDAIAWLMSLGRCIDNLVLAAELPADRLGPRRAMTLPALSVRLGDLVDAIAAAAGGGAEAVQYDPDPVTMAQFGGYPPLLTPAAEALGLGHDGSLEALVARAIADIEPEAEAAL